MKQKMKQARKMLAKKRGTVPVILIPTIPPERIQEIGSLVTITKKSQFIQRLIAYWTLKRQFRNGVPLLRRLQSAQGSSTSFFLKNARSRFYLLQQISNSGFSFFTGGLRDTSTLNVDTIELCRQLKYWQCLRQDLERARLLCELVRKREKMKMEYIKSTEKVLYVQLKPLEASMRKVLDLIAAKDTNEIFLEPVDLEEVAIVSFAETTAFFFDVLLFFLGARLQDSRNGTDGLEYDAQEARDRRIRRFERDGKRFRPNDRQLFGLQQQRHGFLQVSAGILAIEPFFFLSDFVFRTGRVSK